MTVRTKFGIREYSLRQSMQKKVTFTFVYQIQFDRSQNVCPAQKAKIIMMAKKRFKRHRYAYIRTSRTRHNCFILNQNDEFDITPRNQFRFGHFVFVPGL